MEDQYRRVSIMNMTDASPAPIRACNVRNLIGFGGGFIPVGLFLALLSLAGSEGNELVIAGVVLIVLGVACLVPGVVLYRIQKVEIDEFNRQEEIKFAQMKANRSNEQSSETPAPHFEPDEDIERTNNSSGGQEKPSQDEADTRENAD